MRSIRSRSWVIGALLAFGVTASVSSYLWQHADQASCPVRKWAANLKRLPKEGEIWGTESYDHRAFSISTSEGRLEGRDAVYGDQPVDPSRLFVIPPGKWVNSVDEALDIWRAEGMAWCCGAWWPSWVCAIFRGILTVVGVAGAVALVSGLVLSVRLRREVKQTRNRSAAQ